MSYSDEKDNVIPFPDNRAEYENAAFWIVRLNRGLSEDEQTALGQWLQDSPDNPRLLFELAAFWDELDQLSELAALFPLEPSLTVAQPKPIRWTSSWVVATCLVLALGLAGVFSYEFMQSGALWSTPSVEFSQRLVTGVGERVTEILPDGSEVMLNTDTELLVRYQQSERLIDLLQGEAYFTVSHDPARPFGVRVGEHVVQAVGTAFNVRIDLEGEVELIVTEGIVQILDNHRDEDEQLTDTPSWRNRSLVGTGMVQGQTTRLPSDSRTVSHEIRQLDLDDLQVRLAWQHGVLIFEGEPLDIVLQEFTRYTSTDFILGSRELGDLRVGGYFTAGDIDGLLLTLKDNFGIRSERISTSRILLQPAR